MQLDFPAANNAFLSPRVMGILNVTPDSFSDGGPFDLEVDRALERCVCSWSQKAQISLTSVVNRRVLARARFRAAEEIDRVTAGSCG